VCVSTSHLKNEWSVFRATNQLKSCVKLGKNASDTCSTLFELYGVETMKKIVFVVGINGSKWVVRTWKVTKKKLITFFDIKWNIEVVT
jgi:hypothetical protein